MQEDQAQKENSILKVLVSAGLNTLKETKCMKKIKILGKETQKNIWINNTGNPKQLQYLVNQPGTIRKWKIESEHDG